MKRKTVVGIVFALLSAVMLNLTLGGVPVSAQLPVHNVNTGLNYSKIQEAIDAPETLNGHTIQVDPGTYSENVRVTKSLVICGKGGPTVTTVDASGAAGPVFDILASAVTIMNFSLTGGSRKSPDSYGAGIYLRGVTNCNIRKNAIYSNVGHGIYFESSHYNDICNNTVRDNTNHGFHVFYGSHDNKIRQNIITENGGNGLYVSGSYNNITDNVIRLNNQKGMSHRDSVYNRIEKNNVTSNLWLGADLIGCDNCIVRNNNISTSGQWGLRLGSSDNNNITGNVFKANVYSGILIDSFVATPPGDPSHNNVVKNNTFTMNEYGVEIDNDYEHSNNVFYHNNFIDNSVAQAVDPWANTWDDGYPSGGNYWNDYTGVDLYGGANQNQPGCDGIGDTQYVIDADSKDAYPLMFPHGSPPPPSHTLTIITTTGGTTNPTMGTYTYWFGTVVSVIATPNYRLDHWELDGSNVGSTNPYKVTMDKNHALKAFFVYPLVGGAVAKIDKLGLLAPFIGLASTILAATVATAIYVKRVKHRKEGQ